MDPAPPTAPVPLWRTWPTRGWPASAAEEAALRAELGEPGRWDRDDLTMVVTMLRCGSTFAEAARFAPGLTASALAGAYDHIDGLRRVATAAFTRLVDGAPWVWTADEDLLAAEPLLAVPVRRIAAAGTHGVPAASIAVARTLASVQRTTEEIVRREDELSRVPLEARPALGRMFVDPWRGGLWDHPLYLPRRVTDLSPRRVRDLLGERYPDHPLPLVN